VPELQQKLSQAPAPLAAVQHQDQLVESSGDIATPTPVSMPVQVASAPTATAVRTPAIKTQSATSTAATNNAESLGASESATSDQEFSEGLESDFLESLQPITQQTTTQQNPQLGQSTVGTSPSSVPTVEPALQESFAAVKQSVEVATERVSAAAQEAIAEYQIDTPVLDEGWSQALGFRLQVMAQDGVQTAQVQLNPMELGPVDISLEFSEDHLQVRINAENPTTREVIDQAVPRLREMMALAGITETTVDTSGEKQEFAQSDASEQWSRDESADRRRRAAEEQRNAANLDGVVDVAPEQQPRLGSREYVGGQMSFYV